MCLIFSLIPATTFVVFGYLVLQASTRAAGVMQSFGRILSIWAFVVALLFVTCGVWMTISGDCPIEKFMAQMEIPVV